MTGMSKNEFKRKRGHSLKKAKTDHEKISAESDAVIVDVAMLLGPHYPKGADKEVVQWISQDYQWAMALSTYNKATAMLVGA